MFILCCIAVTTACNTSSKKYTLTGELKNCDAQEAIIKIGNERFDTIRIAPDDTFSYATTLSAPSLSFMMIEARGFFPLILINGTSSHLTADLSHVGDYEITGDLAAAYAFKRGTDRSFAQKTGQSYPSFKSFRNTLAVFRDSVARAITAIPDETYRQLQLEQLDGDITLHLILYRDRLAEQGLPLYDDLDYRRYMESVNIDDRDMFASGLTTYAIEWLGGALQRGRDSAYLEMLAVADRRIATPDLKESVLYSLLNDYFSGEGGFLADDIHAQGLALLRDSIHRAHLTATFENFKKLRPGAPAIDCEWEDARGKLSRLSDLYGKLLYIDVWATWCGPCVAEIPYLEKLVERFKGDSRVEFVSVSVDSRKSDWLRKLEADKPQWKQFLCKNFCELYNINGIPRFMLIGKDGKIITVDAPRPSDENVADYIAGYLK